MKKASSVILLCLIFSRLNGQTTFQRLIGGPDHDRAQSILVSSSGGYVVNGATLSFGQGNADATLIKLDSAGLIVWAKVYGNGNYDNSEYAIEAYDRSLVCTGRSELAPGAATSATIFKTDPSGNFLWGKALGGNVNDGLVHIIETSDSGYIAIGNSQSLTSGGSDLLLIRLDENGDTIFTKAYGGPLNEIGTSVIELSDGGFILTGRQSYQTVSGLQADGLLLRTDASGNLLWAKQYGDSLWEELIQVRETSDGYILCGSTVTYGAGSFDILLMKTDTAGDFQWGRTFGGVRTDAAYDLHILSDQSLILSGYTESFGHGHARGDDSTNVFLLKTDSSGNFLWMQAYGDGLQDEGFHTEPTPDAGFIFPAFTESYLLTDSTEMLIIKTDSAGVTGCHEESVIPVDSAVTIPYAAINPLQLSGINFSNYAMIETAISPLSDDACLYTSLTSVINSDKLVAYPNPFENVLRINSEGDEKIILMDLLGQTKISVNAPGEITEINTTDIVPGIYLVTVTNKTFTRTGIIVKY